MKTTKTTLKTAIIAIALSTSIMANAQISQQGDWAVGANINIMAGTSSALPAFGIGANVQYNITNPIRLEASVMYGFERTQTIWFVEMGATTFELCVNAHWLFPVSERISLYPLVGFSAIMARVEVRGLGMTESATSSWYAGVNLGGGIDIGLTDVVSLNADLRWNNQWEGVLIRLGAGFRF